MCGYMSRIDCVTDMYGQQETCCTWPRLMDPSWGPSLTTQADLVQCSTRVQTSWLDILECFPDICIHALAHCLELLARTKLKHLVLP
mmetsp:Transcript_10797/g.66704  ORF Transcript_10797/g.66704 Transcript_10797/m.66704 type:complete len:87 (-) Transcript_10797:1604-1864(-)